MAKWVCTYCLATNGLKSRELDNWPDQGDVDAIAAHIEGEHHMPVRASSETLVQCMERFRRDQPEAAGKNCRCPSCDHGIRGWLSEAIRTEVHGES